MKYSCLFLSHSNEFCYPYIAVALRIHVSNETHSRLNEVGGFYMEERGQVQIKVSISQIFQLVCLFSRVKNLYIYSTLLNQMIIYAVLIYFAAFKFIWQRQGLVTTYWLVGKEGFEKALPDPPLDVSEPLFETLDVYYASWCQHLTVYKQLAMQYI